MRLTLFGFKGGLFYLALVTAFLATPYSNLFFLLLAYLTLQWVSCAVWTPRNLRGVAVELDQLEPVPSGTSGTLRGRVTAPGRPRFQIAVELDLDGGGRAQGQADYVAGKAELAISLPALPRGVWKVKAAHIVSTFPFGVLKARRRIAVLDELIVYPAPVELAPARHASEALAELFGAPSSQASERQPSGLRDFLEGDDERAVHWRATARRGALVVLEHEGTGGQGIELVLDRRCASDRLDEALAQIAALVGFARESKEVLELHTQGLTARFGEGQRPWRDALRFLASAEPLPREGPEPPPAAASVVRLPQPLRSSRPEGEVQHVG